MDAYAYTGAPWTAPTITPPISPTPTCPWWCPPSGTVSAVQYDGTNADAIQADISGSTVTTNDDGSITVALPIGDSVQRYQAIATAWVVTDGTHIIVWKPDQFAAMYAAA